MRRARKILNQPPNEQKAKNWIKCCMLFATKIFASVCYCCCCCCCNLLEPFWWFGRRRCCCCCCYLLCGVCIAILSSPLLFCTHLALFLFYFSFFVTLTHNTHIIAPFRHIYGSSGRSVRSIYKISVRWYILLSKQAILCLSVYFNLKKKNQHQQQQQRRAFIEDRIHVPVFIRFGFFLWGKILKAIKYSFT